MRTAQATKTWDGGGSKRPIWGLGCKICWACRHCRIVQLVVAFELLPWYVCCSLLLTGLGAAMD